MYAQLLFRVELLDRKRIDITYDVVHNLQISLSFDHDQREIYVVQYSTYYRCIV